MKTRQTLIRFVFLLLAFLGLFAPVPSYAQAVAWEAVAWEAVAWKAVDNDADWDDRFGFPGVEGTVTALAVASNGDLYVGGNFTKAGGVAANRIARWDGRRFHPLGNGLGDTPSALLYANDRLYVAGRFESAGEVAAYHLAQWDGMQWSPIGSGEGPRGLILNRVNALALYNGKLIIAGGFTSIDGVAANHVAQWDGVTWSGLGRGMGELNPDNEFIPDYSEVYSLLVVDNSLYAGGQFVVAGEATANAIARWDGASWSAVGTGLFYKDPESISDKATVTALAMLKGSLYVAGTFNKAGDKSVNHIAAWNGAAWNAVGGGVRARPFFSDSPIKALAVSGDVLYVGGDFVSADDKPIGLLAQVNNGIWSAVGGGLANEDIYDVINVLAVGPEGSLYAGGLARVIAGKRVDNIALWANGDWWALGAGILRTTHNDSPATPYAITSDAAGRVFVGGRFAYAGGVKVDNLAMWAEGQWHNIGGTNGDVRALVLDGDDLYVAGAFTQAGGQAANHIARWNRVTGEWAALGAGINGDVYALALGESVLYAGGAFNAAGSVTAEDVAYWDGGEWHALGTKARIFEVGNRGNEIGTYVNALAVSADGGGDRLTIGGHFQTIQFGTNIADLRSFVVVHNLVEWVAQRDTWGWVGTPQHPGVTVNGASGSGVDVHALTLVGDFLYVAGRFNQAGESAANGVARYDLTLGGWTTLDASLGGVEEAQAYALAVYGTDLYVGGKFTSAGNSAANFVARLDTSNDSWSALGSGIKWYNDRFTAVYALGAGASGLYLGGNFDRAGGLSATGFARWGGLRAQPNVTPENGGTVNGVPVQGNGGSQLLIPAGALAEASIVTLNTNPQSGLIDGQQTLLYSVRATARSLAGRLHTKAAKPFTLQMSYSAAQLAAVGVNNPNQLTLAQWNGTGWQPLLPCAGCTVDQANQRLTVVTDAFGEFALISKADGTTPPPASNQMFLPLVVR